MAKKTPYANSKEVRDKMEKFVSDDKRTLIGLTKEECNSLLLCIKLIETERRNLRSRERKRIIVAGGKTRFLD